MHQVHDDAPQLPYGYPVMILAALVPPLWRKLMDDRVRAYRQEVEKKFGPLNLQEKGKGTQ